MSARWRSVHTGLLILVVLGSRAEASEPAGPPAEAAVFDCGTIALYHLMKWEDHSVDLATIAASLPPCPPAGYSMKELRDEARRRGVWLEGVQLASIKAIDGPALAGIKEGDHGHHVAIRPLDASGQWVQVADLDRTPRVVVASVLAAEPSWTGMVLMQVPPNSGRRLLPGFVAACAAVGAIVWLRASLRRSGGIIESVTHSTNPAQQQGGAR